MAKKRETKRAADGSMDAQRPRSIMVRPLTADFKAILKAASKGLAHVITGQWDGVGVDAVELGCAVGLKSPPEELAYALVHRAYARALTEIVSELAKDHFEASSLVVVEELSWPEKLTSFRLPKNFFNGSAELPVLGEVSPLVLRWLLGNGLDMATAKSAISRLPAYFVCGLHDEWRSNSALYQPLALALHSPFVNAATEELSWQQYRAMLSKVVQESVFGEAFSLKQLYIPLAGYYITASKALDSFRADPTRVAVNVDNELLTWLRDKTSTMAIRVLSGGPGSGKSTVAKMFAAEAAKEPSVRPLYVPLHLINPDRDLVAELGAFVKQTVAISENPLDSTRRDVCLLLIFDGLDELSAQGNGPTDTARRFIEHVERVVEKKRATLHIRVLFCGRELIVQGTETLFRDEGQIVHLLPYCLTSQQKSEIGDISDPSNVLSTDRRALWWKQYGELTGQQFRTTPNEITAHEELNEVSSQPLLNYLVALSLRRGKLSFDKELKLNAIYSDLVTAVYERGYERRRIHGAISRITLEEFFRVLEEVALAAWHGDSRSATVSEIEAKCTYSGVRHLLEAFQEGARAGITRLLAAFFFKQYGHRRLGDPTFVFTHKTFGEYLTARRIVAAMRRMVVQRERRSRDYNDGADERTALAEWVDVCGPSALTRTLLGFLRREVELHGADDVKAWHVVLLELFRHAVLNGMPLELRSISPFKEQMRYSRNAEECLLAAMEACARVGHVESNLKFQDRRLFGGWLRRIQGGLGQDAVVTRCLSRSNLSGSDLNCINFGDADLSHSDLRQTLLSFSFMGNANTKGAKLHHVESIAVGNATHSTVVRNEQDLSAAPAVQVVSAKIFDS